MLELISIVIALLVAVSVHEAAHAAAAYYLGDPTAKLAGRMTLNPIKHLDPLGTLMIVIARFGWGKPVPVNTYNLKNPRRDEALISLAGPMSNLLTAAVLALPLKYLLLSYETGFLGAAAYVLTITIYLNVALMVFNLIPIPPLDGSKILIAFLPIQWESKIRSFERNGFLLLFAIIIFSRIIGVPIFAYVVGPLVDLVLSVIFLTT